MKTLALLALALGLAAPCLAAVDDAQRVTDQLHLTTMMTKILDQQKVMIDRTIRQMLPRARPNADPAAVEKAVVEQEKLMDQVWSSINLNQVEEQMTQVYRSVFTPEELHGLADFYSSPAGQAAIAKQPLIQEKMMQLMMPKIMAAIRLARLRAASAANLDPVASAR